MDVAWSPDSKQVVYQVQNREQTWLDLNTGAAGGRHAADAVSRDDQGLGEQHGVARLAEGRRASSGSASAPASSTSTTTAATARSLGQVTSGQWEVRTLYGVDETAGFIYFAGTERSAIGGDVYRIKLDGIGLSRACRRRRARTAPSFNPSFTEYVGTWSDINTPTQTRLYKADGTELRVIDRNEVPALKQYRLSQPEFVR